MLQTNLREIDATMDIDQYIRELKEWKVNVVKFSVGGIVANYPTDVKYHWRNTFKGKRPDLMLYVMDVIRSESGAPLGRGAYYDTDKVKSAMLTMGLKQYNNTANHFFEMPYRHAGAAPSVQARRVRAQAVNGAWLGFYIMGPLHRLEDRAALNVLKNIYRFHQANEIVVLEYQDERD